MDSIFIPEAIWEQHGLSTWCYGELGSRRQNCVSRRASKNNNSILTTCNMLWSINSRWTRRANPGDQERKLRNDLFVNGFSERRISLEICMTTWTILPWSTGEISQRFNGTGSEIATVSISDWSSSAALMFWMFGHKIRNFSTEQSACFLVLATSWIMINSSKKVRIMIVSTFQICNAFVLHLQLFLVPLLNAE